MQPEARSEQSLVSSQADHLLLYYDYNFAESGVLLVNFNQLENYLCVCEELSITKASHRLYISQPALSQQIARLEQEVGSQLFSRNGTALRLLPAGIILRESAKRILNEYYLAQNNIKNLHSDPENSVLNVAITKPRAFLLLSYVLPRFYRENPNIQVITNEVDSFEVEPLLLNGSVDLGFCNPPEYMPLHKHLIFREQLLVAVPQEHPINQLEHDSDGRYPVIRPEELDGQLFVMPSSDNAIFQSAQTFFKLHKIQPKVHIVTHVGEHIHFLTAANLGFSFVYEMSISLQATYQQPPVYYALPDRPYSKPWYLAYRDDHPLTESMQRFIDFNAECFRNYPF